ncbi:MAG TPA: LysE family translocator, partial [Povalibacter sp.]
MNELLPSAPLFAGFLVASFVLAVTPGPGVLYIVTRSVTEGRASGLASVAGVALGNMVNAVAASVGIAAIFAVSTLAFSVVKYAGAAYLIYLGLRTLRTSSRNESERLVAPANHRKVFIDGFLVAALNPKTALFFAAFLPQFMHGPASIARSALLGAVFVATAFV